MCLAVPARVLTLLPDSMAEVDIRGTRISCSMMLLDGEVAIGSWVLVHAGFAIERVDPAEAERTLADLRAMEGERADHV